MANIWKLIQIVCLSRIISANSGKSNFDEEIYKLANDISRKYFGAYKCVTYAADDVSNVDYLQVGVPKFVINLSGGGGAPSREGDIIRETIEQGCGGVIVQTRTENRLQVALSFKTARTRVTGNRYNSERYLFLPESVNDTDADFLLHEHVMYFLPNLLFVSRDESRGRFLIRTHEIFDPERSDRVEVLDTWTRSAGFDRGADLYPDKVENLKGKPLVFGVMPYIPYSVVAREGNGTVFDGIEARIAWEFLKTVNGTFAALNHPVELWGIRFPNGTGNGIFGSVLRHDADLGYSAIYQWDCDILDCTYPYIEAEIYCLVPRPRILTSWMTLLLPFKPATWIGLSVAYVVSFSFVFVLGFASKRLSGAETSSQRTWTVFQSAFTIFRLQMLQIPTAAHRSSPVAVYLRIAFLFYFFVSIFWQGGIASILTVPRYEKPIDTPKELVSRWPEVEWGSNHDVWKFSIQTSTDPILQEVVKKYRTLDMETLMRRSKTRDFAFFLERLPNNHFGFTENINEESVPHLRLMKENMYTAFDVMILPKGSPLTEKFDRLIHWLVATGIIQKMENQISLERINNHLQLMIQHSNDRSQNSRAVLTVNHIRGALYIYFGGILISVVALIGEKFLNRRKCKKINRQKIKRIFKRN